MKYKITVHFNDGHDETYGVDYYSAIHCTLELFIFNTIGTPQVIKIFPLLDIKEIEIQEATQQ